MKSKSRIENSCIFLLSAVAFVMVILICSDSAIAYLPQKFGGTLRVGVPSRILKIDPTMAVEDHEFLVAGCIFETLLAQEAGNSMVPLLLEELPAQSDDRLTYYFKLREGVRFHDGTLLDSADVVHSFRKLASHRKSPYSWIFKDVAGLEDFRSGASRSLEGIRITDPLRFEITLSKENLNFLKYLTFPAASIIPTSDREYEPPIGTGPFVFLSKNSKSDITVAANTDYRDGRPYLDTIEFLLLRDGEDRFTEFIRGEIDVVDYPQGGLERDMENLFDPPLVSTMKRMYFIDINPLYRSIETSALRSSVSSFLDRTGIVRNIFNGNGSVETNISSIERPVSNPVNGERLPLWFPDNSTETKSVAVKISSDLEDNGYSVIPTEINYQGLLQYSHDDAPAMILRTLPVLFSMGESLEEPLYNMEYRTRQTASAIRLADLNEIVETRGTIVMIFSRRASYLHLKKVHGLEPGFHGELIFDNTFIREEYSEIERLEN